MMTWEFFIASEDSAQKKGMTYFPWGYLFETDDIHPFHTFNGLGGYPGGDFISWLRLEEHYGKEMMRLSVNGGTPFTKFKRPDPSETLTTHRFLYEGQWWEINYRILPQKS